jgi:signal transduction histidine kinase
MNTLTMNSPAATAPTAPTAFEAALGRVKKRLPRTALVVGVVCLAIALILTAFDGRGFAIKLIYSLCIGTVCNTIVFAAMLLSGWATDMLYRVRGRPLPEQSQTGWRGVVPGSIVAALIGPPMGLTLADWITGFTSPSVLNLNSTSTRLTLLFSVLATIVSLFILQAQERVANARAQAEAAQRQAAENQLRLLQSQLEPHMLFNTLANLRVLIGMDPARAQAMLDRLIAFLRATLNASRTPQQALATEFERVADYLALMGVRMGPRLQSSLDLPDALRTLAVPSLLLQPLVENAIKHGLEPKVQGGRIDVTARQEGATLVLTVRDTGIGMAAAAAAAGQEGSHFGLAQARERLTTLFGHRATLEVQESADAEGGVQVTLRMPATTHLPTAQPPTTRTAP